MKAKILEKLKETFDESAICNCCSSKINDESSEPLRMFNVEDRILCEDCILLIKNGKFNKNNNVVINEKIETLEKSGKILAEYGEFLTILAKEMKEEIT